MFRVWRAMWSLGPRVEGVAFRARDLGSRKVTEHLHHYLKALAISAYSYDNYSI